MSMDYGYLCCEPVLGDDKELEDDTTVSCSTEEQILEVDYDTQVTKLYSGIEERKWEEVLYFLETDTWYSNSVFSVFADRDPSAEEQAKTWVTALDHEGSVRWCQLPLHAAVTFLAPHAVVKKLIDVYPKSVRCADDQDMLPLHYAFRFGAADDVLLLLLESFPQAIGKMAVKNRLPLDLAQYGPRPQRGKIIEYYMQSAVRNAKEEWDREYEKIVSQVRSESEEGVARTMQSKDRELENKRDELQRLQRELSLLKREKLLDEREARSRFKGVKSPRSTRSFRSKSPKHKEEESQHQDQQQQQQQSSTPNSKSSSSSPRKKLGFFSRRK